MMRSDSAVHEQAAIEAVISYGVFGVLFVCLLLYVLKQNAKREDRLINHAEKLQASFHESTETLKLMKQEMKSDLEEIKNLVKGD